MVTPRVSLPDIETLSANINSVLNKTQFATGQVNILSRTTNDYATTFPSEVITCQLPDGNKLGLLCKYAAGLNHESYGHRGGVPYEAEIYQNILQKLTVSTPAFYGTGRDELTGEQWIILEYFEEELRVRASDNSTSMQAAARWLGDFHRENEKLLRSTPFPFLNRHDAVYYSGWVDRTLFFADRLQKRPSWLDEMGKYFREGMHILLSKQENIIHGEYYPANILYYREHIYPIDWESTAIGIGEIDLASLIEKWPLETAEECTRIYTSNRWPEGQPNDFEQKLILAQLYWLFRWLGDGLEWTRETEGERRLERLQFLGMEMGVL